MSGRSLSAAAKEERWVVTKSEGVAAFAPNAIARPRPTPDGAAASSRGSLPAVSFSAPRRMRDFVRPREGNDVGEGALAERAARLEGDLIDDGGYREGADRRRACGIRWPLPRIVEGAPDRACGLGLVGKPMRSSIAARMKPRR